MNFLINLYPNKYKIITMITADLCIIPMGIDESSVGKYVAEAAKIIEKSWLEISNNRYGDSN